MALNFSSDRGFAPPTIEPLCGFFVNSQRVRTDFAPTDATKLKRTLQMASPGELPSPLASVTELSCFIWPGAQLPPENGIQVYWQISGLPDPNNPNVPPPSTGFELLGSLTPERPSQVFRTGWSEHEQLLEIMSSNIPVVVTFGISVEPLENIQNLQVVDRVENRLVVAQKIAADLFRYMRSFDTGGAGGSGQMIVPTNIFDRWLRRFEARFRRDPNFFLKAEELD